MINEYGYLRVAAVSPELKLGNVDFNTEEIIKTLKELETKKVSVAVFPEMSITGYSCGDLFLNDHLLDKAIEGLVKIKKATKKLKITSLVGLPIRIDNQLFNVGAVIENGQIKGIVPKSFIPNYSEFYEKRYFKEAKDLNSTSVVIDNEEIPVGTDLIFQDEKYQEFTFGLEICEDMWVVDTPSNKLCLGGAKVIFNLSASNEVIGKYEYRRNLISSLAAKNLCGYVYASSGVGESTSDLVFSGYCGIYENGTCLKENERFNFNTNYVISDIDIKRIDNMRLRNTNYGSINEYFRIIKLSLNNDANDLLRTYNPYPFVPSDSEIVKRCSEIINIQAFALARRIRCTNSKTCVLGLSGGLDSTLAFLIIMESFKILNIDSANLIAITMPGFGTTDRTLNNAANLAKGYGCTFKEIPIKDVCEVHFKDIGLSSEDRSVTYENAQARSRTQILMDIANKENGLVIGTGDMSEAALGWCTYNGDHMSMYAVNISIPKTLVRYLVKYYASKEENKKVKKALEDILDTPISPELLPPSKDGKILQKTEEKVGPYILHDFFLYHFLRYGASPKKIYYIACKTFKDMYSKEEIEKWLNFFLRRFTMQQFKRSCMPDGPKVGTISLSPRGDLRLPSDLDINTLLGSDYNGDYFKQ